MLVNSVFPSIDQTIEYKTELLISKIYKFQKNNYWLVEVASLNKDLLIQVIPDDIRCKIRTGEIKLAISNTFEGFTSIIDGIYQVLTELELPEDNVILFTGNKEILSTVYEVASLYNKKHIKCIWVSFAEFSINVQSRLIPINNRVYQHTYSKKFLNFNRRWRPHRPTLVSLLLIRNLIDYGYVSLTEFEGFGWDNVWENMLYLNNKSNIRSLLEQHKTEIKSLPNLHIDKESLEGLSDRLDPNLQKFYDETYFSLVTETYFYNSDDLKETGISLSEKTFKPIVYNHPFILVGQPYSLKTLRELGYKTFHPLINEDYDCETDPCKRLLMVLDEVERLCNLNSYELSKFIEQSKSICEFNHRHLFSPLRKNKFTIELN